MYTHTHTLSAEREGEGGFRQTSYFTAFAVTVCDERRTVKGTVSSMQPDSAISRVLRANPGIYEGALITGPGPNAPRTA